MTTTALRYRSASRSHSGPVRPLNEDSFVDRPDVRLWAVADGMGGHHDGQGASALAARALNGLDGRGTGHAALNAVSDALTDVNEQLIGRAARLPSGVITGTTVVALLIRDEHAACIWAGDSRAYHLSAGQLRPLTRDHSIAQELIDSGALTPAEARASRQAHVITRAIGSAATLHLDTRYAPVASGDRFLLCSDGLTGAVSEAEIANLLARGDAETAAEALLQRALDRQATDNVTLVVIAAL